MSDEPKFFMGYSVVLNEFVPDYEIVVVGPNLQEVEGNVLEIFSTTLGTTLGTAEEEAT